MTHPIDRSRQKAYIVGSGVAGLAAAVYLVREAGLDGRNITLFNQEGVSGGAMDGSGSAEKGYLIRGGRMHEAHYVCTWDLLAGIPRHDPDLSVTQEVFDFNQQVVSCSHARLLRGGKKMDVSSYGLSKRDIFDLLRLNTTPEFLLDNKTIADWLLPSFLTRCSGSCGPPLSPFSAGAALPKCAAMRCASCTCCPVSISSRASCARFTTSMIPSFCPSSTGCGSAASTS